MTTSEAAITPGLAEATARLRRLPTAAISDALDSLGLAGALQGIRALSQDLRMAGPAFTVRYLPDTSGRGSVGDFLDDVPRGAVVVIDNAARTDVTVWGGIMSESAAALGVAGTVINGVCRDVSVSLGHHYPVFSRGHFMRTGKDRVQLAAVGGDLSIAGVPIAAGDLVCGDADGVVAVPAAHAARVAEIAGRIDDIESRVAAAVRDGRPLRQARTEYGYHDLQRRNV